MRTVHAILVAAMALAAAGCAQQLGSHQPSLDAVQALRSGDIVPMRTGPFALAPGLPGRLDKSVTARSVTLTSPDSDSLAAYLQKALETDLRAAGKFDPNSNLVVQGLLTESKVDAGIGTGDASLGAEFSLLADGKTIFRKNLVVRSEWDSSFIGAIAIPEAINQYGSLYDKLVVKLLTDEDFRTAESGAKKTAR